jgi:hypothetical protein
MVGSKKGLTQKTEIDLLGGLSAGQPAIGWIGMEGGKGNRWCDSDSPPHREWQKMGRKQKGRFKTAQPITAEMPSPRWRSQMRLKSSV